MTYFMAYVVLVSAGIAACALALELVLRSRTTATRWIWVSAMGAIVAATAAVSFVPRPRVNALNGERTRPAAVDGLSAPTITVEATAVRRASAILRMADDALPTAWLMSSLLLLAAILYGQRRLSRERGAAQHATVRGREVLLTEDVGPAVAGIGQPVVLLPRWVLALDAPSQQLLLDHEFEHLRHGDTRVLLTGAVATAIMPWNPVVWWVTRRLRLAVEQDCDARVLRNHPNVRRYADLLLMAASQPRMSTRLLAAHFGEHRSDLDRRIRAMTERKLNWNRMLAAVAVAATLVAVSCEAPRPAPLAPGKQESAPPQVASANAVFYEFQVEKPVTLVSGSPMPRYPEILRQAGVEGEALVSFVVDESGSADSKSFKVIRATHELFAMAVKQMLPSMRFVPAEIGGKKVKQLVQQPFTFDLPGAASSVEPQLDAPTTEGKRLAFTVKRSERPVTTIVDSQPDVSPTAGKRLAFTVKRNEKTPEAWEPKAPPAVVLRKSDVPSDPVNFELLSSRGDVVSRYSSSRMPSEVRVEDIAAIEVFKSRSCPVGSSCPLIRITLKTGREAAYRPR